MLPNLSNVAIKKKETIMHMPTINTDESIINDFYSIINGPTADTDIPTYVMNNIYKILDLGVVQKNSNALHLLINDKFLSALVDLTRKEKIDFSADVYRNKMNRICYDYTRMKDKNVFIQNLLYSIVYNINKQKVQTLMGLELSKEQSCLLIAARYSTASDIRINYKRLVRSIQSMDSELMTEQKIVDIFGKICTDQVRQLFIAVMLDRFETFYTDKEEYVYSTVNLSLLDVVESMPMDSIYIVIKAYLDAQTHSTKKPRFKLKSINVGDYPRINQTIDILESQGIYVY